MVRVHGVTEPEVPLADRRAGAVAWGDAPSFLLGARRSVEVAGLPVLPALRMVTQPILDLRTGRAAGYEALARFADGTPPDRRFGEAHARGRGAELEAQAVRAALELTGRPAGAYLSLNASPTAIGTAAFVATLPPSLEGIVIEVTEHEPFESNTALIRNLAALRDRGARIAVDDAGSGYAGLRQLTSLRPDIVKLDRTLVAGIDADTVKSAMVYALVEFAHGVGATICAEGIERPEELAALAELGVSHGQGWFIAVPGDDWPTPSTEAVDLCTRSIDAALRSHWTFESHSSDRRLAIIASAAAAATTPEDVVGVLELISRDLDAEHVCLSTIIDEGSAVQTLIANESFDGGLVFPLDTHPLTAHVLRSGDMVQVRSTDPEADSAELDWMVPAGYLGLLMAPVGPRHRPVALLELCSRTERPWSHAELYRTRVICQLLSALVQNHAEP